jgi:hypothetical protein
MFAQLLCSSLLHIPFMNFVTEIVTKAILGWVLMSHGAKGGPGGGNNNNADNKVLKFLRREYRK